MTKKIYHDYISDLHLDNGMMGGPHYVGKNFDILSLKNDIANVLLIAGDTCNHRDDTNDFIISASEHYDHVIAIYGNHEGWNLDNITKINDKSFILTEDSPLILGNIAYLGGDIGDDTAMEKIVDNFHKIENYPVVEEIVLLEHLAPTPSIGLILGRNINHKSNDLLDRITPARKKTTIVFGHLHLNVDTTIDNVRCVSHPRGYKGILRDGSYWDGKFALLEKE